MIPAIQPKNMVSCNSVRITPICLSKNHASKRHSGEIFIYAEITEDYLAHRTKPADRYEKE